MERTFNGRTYLVDGIGSGAGWVKSAVGELLLGFSVDAASGATHALGFRGGEWRGADAGEVIARALREIEGEAPVLRCCPDPEVRGGRCESCGTWVEDAGVLR